MIFYALSNAAYCVSLCGLGAELEGVLKHPRSGAIGAEHRGRGLTRDRLGGPIRPLPFFLNNS